jgi:hypothetical protein
VRKLLVYLGGMEALKANIETLAAEENKTPLQIISALQAGAVKLGNNELLDALCEIKWDYIEL